MGTYIFRCDVCWWEKEQWDTWGLEDYARNCEQCGADGCPECQKDENLCDNCIEDNKDDDVTEDPESKSEEPSS